MILIIEYTDKGKTIYVIKMQSLIVRQIFIREIYLNKYFKTNLVFSICKTENLVFVIKKSGTLAVSSAVIISKFKKMDRLNPVYSGSSCVTHIGCL